jgi:hypothetical protein
MHARMKEELKKFHASYPYFAANCLKIQTKENELKPFIFNTAQIYLHKQLEMQRKETGRVRAMVLKGRQQGISTYTGGRFYRRASLNRGINVYILSHEQKATDNLFKMVERFHSHNPIAPHTGAANAKELAFDRLDSAYAVGTAGAKAGGRGRTPHLFHGSEVAFWQNPKDHFASSVQGVPDARGTEIILETTANGASGEYFERWQEAEAGESDYIPIFIPWFWQVEYQREVGPDFELSGEMLEGEMSEIDYAEFFGCTKEQMAWRRAKIRELRSVALFNQEYPATATLAFQSSDGESYIKGPVVLRARKSDVKGGGPLIIGVDPAGEGGDRFCVALRRGHESEKIMKRNKINAVEACDWIDDVIQQYDPALVNIDAGGLGAPLIDFLRARRPEYRTLIKSINFGSRSQHKNAKPHAPGPKLRRDEMWMRMKEWLELEEGVKIPDDDALQADLIGPRKKDSHNNDFSLESKDSMRSRGIRSPDLADALALTFADLKRIENFTDKRPSGKYGNKLERTVEIHPNGNIVGHSGSANGWMAG